MSSLRKVQPDEIPMGKMKCGMLWTDEDDSEKTILMCSLHEGHEGTCLPTYPVGEFPSKYPKLHVVRNPKNDLG
jgi:hypothetical protein